MTTPPCPRCGAPLCNGTQLRVYCATCTYGHDAPRTLIPQPDPVGVAGNGLLPCPFCGGPAFDDFDDPDGAGHIVGCDNRACPINPEKFMDHVGEDHDVRAGLRAAWNTRGKT